MHSRTLRQAEKTAIEGTNESQDTLLLAHHLMMDFGVGLVSGVDNPSNLLSASRECGQSDFPACPAEQLTNRGLHVPPFSQSEPANGWQG